MKNLTTDDKALILRLIADHTETTKNSRSIDATRKGVILVTLMTLKRKVETLPEMKA